MKKYFPGYFRGLQRADQSVMTEVKSSGEFSNRFIGFRFVEAAFHLTKKCTGKKDEFKKQYGQIRKKDQTRGKKDEFKKHYDQNS